MLTTPLLSFDVIVHDPYSDMFSQSKWKCVCTSMIRYIVMYRIRVHSYRERGGLLAYQWPYVSSLTYRANRYGHYINQARAAGALVATTNGSPMNELIDNASGVLIDATLLREAYVHAYDVESLCSMIYTIQYEWSIHIFSLSFLPFQVTGCDLNLLSRIFRFQLDLDTMNHTNVVDSSWWPKGIREMGPT